MAEMKNDGLDNVRGEKVMVPHWVRGEESLEMISPRPLKLAMLGLGNSVGTPAEGITAEAVVVRNFDHSKPSAIRCAEKLLSTTLPLPATAKRFAIVGQALHARRSMVRSLQSFAPSLR